MHHTRRWVLISSILFAVMAGPTVLQAHALAPNDAASAMMDAVEQAECKANVARLKSEIEDVTIWSNVLVIAGAIVSSAGSGLAAFLNAATKRRAAAFLGMMGAVATVMPRVLPDKQKLQEALTAAERHRVVGAKVERQLRYAADEKDEYTITARMYASARFTECASLNPPAEVPDLPLPSQDRRSEESPHAVTEPATESPVANFAAPAPALAPSPLRPLRTRPLPRSRPPKHEEPSRPATVTLPASPSPEYF